MNIEKHYFSSGEIEFVKDFINNPGKRYIYGRTKEAASLAKNVAVDGFIDDYTKEKDFLGLPVCTLEAVPKDARIVSAVVQAYPIAVYKKLKAGNYSFCDYFAFKEISKLPLQEIPYWIGAKKHFEENKKDYAALYDALVDDVSKDIFNRVINFRLNYDLSQMNSFVANLKGMYFEDFLKIPKNNAVFFDVGSFDGYNSQHFSQLYPEMARAVLFEPLPAQEVFLKEKYIHDPRFIIFALALSDKDGFSKFSIDNTSSHLTNDGAGIDIKTIRLDDFCERYKFKPDLIKMDIEGAEIKALSGALDTIKNCKPNLAISVYHHPAHIIEVYKLILSACPGYKFYLRHYTEGYTETVLFAVP